MRSQAGRCVAAAVLLHAPQLSQPLKIVQVPWDCLPAIKVCCLKCLERSDSDAKQGLHVPSKAARVMLGVCPRARVLLWWQQPVHMGQGPASLAACPICPINPIFKPRNGSEPLAGGAGRGSAPGAPSIDGAGLAHPRMWGFAQLQGEQQHLHFQR